ncbi:Transcription factor-like 5 protein [Merluccius polli]|uniref:Transcription factor-like 5 protein n=1 Tax=Merluccius polli TaxID=89951 RepID=A0AA47MWI2_MERPO|nr:Transcription factor-like 5 protein [Merluccius polli]
MSVHEMGQLLGTEINLMEMTEIEYTHLQHLLLQTHMEGQAADPDGLDLRFPTTIFGVSVTAQPAATKPDTGSAKMFPSPTSQAIDLSTSNDEQCATVPDPRLGETVDIGELDMVIACSGGFNDGEKTPSNFGEVPGSVLTRARREVGETLTEAPDGCGSSLSRPHSTARVCLEKRFGCRPEDVPRQQDTQMAVLTNFSNPQNLKKQANIRKQACIHKCRSGSNRIALILLSFQIHTEGPCSTQSLACVAFGHISHIVEPNKNQGLTNTNNFLSYCPERAAGKAQCISHTNQTEEQEWVKVEKEAVPTAPKHPRARTLRRPSGPPQLEGTKAAVEAGKSGRKRAGTLAESSQRREKHNSKERDRRKRIRMCCNELNTLVPFCRPDTDKASTLQWTTAFLKHIQEVNGDSLKESFQSAFCGKTGLRLTPGTESDQLHVHQEMAGTASTPLAAQH